MNIVNARLRGREGLFHIALDGSQIAAITEPVSYTHLTLPTICSV